MEESWETVQSNPRVRPEWTYSQGVARDSCSSMYKDVHEYNVAINIKRND